MATATATTVTGAKGKKFIYYDPQSGDASPSPSPSPSDILTTAPATSPTVLPADENNPRPQYILDGSNIPKEIDFSGPARSPTPSPSTSKK